MACMENSRLVTPFKIDLLQHEINKKEVVITTSF